MTTYHSRPRAICVDLVETLLTEHHVLPEVVRIVKQRDATDGFHMSRRGTEILQASDNARLPTVVLTDLPKSRLLRALQALPCDPDLVISSEDCSLNEERGALLKRAADGLGMAANDILYVGNSEGSEVEAAISFGMRTCAGDDAVKQLELLHIDRRRALLPDRFGDDAELANTVLLPLDLNLYDMGDTDCLHRGSHFVFDTSLIVEGLVATSGFGLKIIEKDIGSRAVLVYGITDEDHTPDVAAIVRERLGRIRIGGGAKVILVHTGNPAEVDDHKIAEIAQSFGYCVELRTWKTLMSHFDQETTWET